jgi:hypothetical protein
MATIKKVDKRVIMGRRDIIKFQLMTHCFAKKIILSNAETECLALLGYTGQQDLSEFCNLVVESEIFKTPQSVRNFVGRAEKQGFLYKSGTSRKRIELNSELNILTEGNILLNYKVVYVEAQ